ncbi:MAG: hypothetical protein J4215_02900 [Candidatus Diapherotrites archaeon]|uniref:Uncharacterized protein n=1 Tax=Candidatus Iainarchaeum sp. TaxID=3101447 RepID=A0A8T4LDY3_9ARCH|nr:hypothetical protein [Candidatus Diapherotrites archaeon]
MVKFRFCPACGAIDMHVQSDGTDKCGTCKYVGTAIEGAPDKLNEYKKKLKNGTAGPQSHNPEPAPGVAPTPSTNPLIGSTTVNQTKKNGLIEKHKPKATDEFEIW